MAADTWASNRRGPIRPPSIAQTHIASAAMRLRATPQQGVYYVIARRVR
jgi:hypothetical protein